MSGPSPEETFRAVHRETGGRLFTVTVLDRAAGLARRCYTSHPDAYPVSGTKPMAQGAWTERVIERGEVFVANTVAEFAPYFGDHALIESLGCAAALNIPVPRGGAVIGTVNVLDREGAFPEAEVRRCTGVVASFGDALAEALSATRP